MIANNLAPRLFLKISRVIFFSLYAGMVTFLLMALYLAENKFFFKADLAEPVLPAVFILAIIIIPAGWLISKMIFGKIDPNDQLNNKLTKYQSGQLLRLATGECVGLLSSTGILLTSNLVFLVFLFISIIVMLLYYPTPDRIAGDINLTQNEIEKFYN